MGAKLLAEFIGTYRLGKFGTFLDPKLAVVLRQTFVAGNLE